MIFPEKIKRRKLLRLPHFDYSQCGYYFVTICTKDKRCLFGDVIDGKMVLNEVGKMVENEWKRTPEIRRNVSLDAFVVMPNHIHGIIIINYPVGAYCNTPLQSPSNTLGAIVRGFKSASATRIKKYLSNDAKQNFPEIVWQRNFYEHVIRNEKSLLDVQTYILNNPLKWELDAENPKNFP